MADKKIERNDVLDLTKGKEAVKAKIAERKAKMKFFIDNEKAIAKASAK